MERVKMDSWDYLFTFLSAIILLALAIFGMVIG